MNISLSDADVIIPYREKNVRNAQKLYANEIKNADLIIAVPVMYWSKCYNDPF